MAQAEEKPSFSEETRFLVYCDILFALDGCPIESPRKSEPDMRQTDPFSSLIVGLDAPADLQHYPAKEFPTIHPVHWLTSHFAVGGFSPMRRLSGMLTAHMTQIEPGNGFAWHPHRGLEIYTYVIDGEIYHEDTTGGRGVIAAGEVQRMFSGHYIEHQELNQSDRTVRVIQIWFAVDPIHQGVAPHYEQIELSDMPARAIGDGLARTSSARREQPTPTWRHG